jgi:hypothetical protein
VAKAVGLPQTRTLALGSVWFSPTNVRTGATQVNVGDQIAPGTAVLAVTGTGQQVTAAMNLADQKLAVVGGRVTVSLPNAQSTPGHITSVGPPTDQKGGIR